MLFCGWWSGTRYQNQRSSLKKKLKTGGGKELERIGASLPVCVSQRVLPRGGQPVYTMVSY